MTILIGEGFSNLRRMPSRALDFLTMQGNAGNVGEVGARALACCLATLAALMIAPSESPAAKKPGLVAKSVPGTPPAAFILGTIGKRALYFDDFSTNSDLFVTTGKRGGTRRLRRGTAPPTAAASAPRVNSAEPYEATDSGRIVFALEDSDHGREWWSTDGTSAGTRMLVDATPGPASSVGQYDAPVYMGGDKVIIPVSDPEHGREWWVTDGTPEATRLIADINPGPASSHFDFTQVDRIKAGGLLYFTAKSNSSDQVQRLWRTDGTEAGTFSLGVVLLPGGLVGGEVDGELLFNGGPFYGQSSPPNAIWRTDGTVEGTKPYYDFPTDQPGAGGFTKAGGRLFIGINGALWRVDSPDSPPVLLRDFGATGNGITGVQADGNNRSTFGQTFGENLAFQVLGGTPPADITVDDWISLGTPETTRPLTALDRVCTPGACTDGGRLYVTQRRGKRMLLKSSAGTRRSERKIATRGEDVGWAINGLVRAQSGTYFVNAPGGAPTNELWKISRAR